MPCLAMYSLSERNTRQDLKAIIGLSLDIIISWSGFIDKLEGRTSSSILATVIYQLFVTEFQMGTLGIGKKKLEQHIKLLEVLFCNQNKGAVNTVKEGSYYPISGHFHILGLLHIWLITDHTISVCALIGTLKARVLFEHDVVVGLHVAEVDKLPVLLITNIIGCFLSHGRKRPNQLISWF